MALQSSGSLSSQVCGSGETGQRPASRMAVWAAMEEGEVREEEMVPTTAVQSVQVSEETRVRRARRARREGRMVEVEEVEEVEVEKEEEMVVM